MFYRVKFFSLGRIRSGLERIVEVPLCSPHQDTQVRIKCLLLSSVSSPDWSPQAKENLNQSCSTITKSLNFSESTPSNATNKENMRLDVNQEMITPHVPQFSAELNGENLCGKQTTQLKVLIVNPNGRFDSHCSVADETLFHNCLLLLLMNIFFLLSAHTKMI